MTVEVDNHTMWTVAELAEGIPYFFAVTAYDRYGNESDFSEEVSQTIYEDAEDLSTNGWDWEHSQIIKTTVWSIPRPAGTISVGLVACRVP